MRPLDISTAGTDLRRIGPGRYLDGDGFNELDLIVVEDGMGSRLVATVLYGGVPVLTVTDQDADDFEYPVWYACRANEQAQAAFLVWVGELSEEAPAYVAEHGLEKVWDREEYVRDDGHSICGFVDRVTEALAEEAQDAAR